MADLRSGQIDVAVAGTAVQGPSTPSGQNARFTITAHPSNTGAAYVGNDGSTGTGDVSSATGVALNPGEQLVVNVPDLGELMFDVTTSGDDLCWFYHG